MSPPAAGRADRERSTTFLRARPGAGGSLQPPALGHSWALPSPRSPRLARERTRRGPGRPPMSRSRPGGRLPTMHVVIMGCGRVGLQLTSSSRKDGHEVAIIDKNAAAFEKLPPGFEAKTFVGLGFDRDVLEEAGIREADAFVAVSSAATTRTSCPRAWRSSTTTCPKRHRPDLRPSARRDLRAAQHPHRRHHKWGVKQIQLMLFHDRNEVRETPGRRRPAAHARPGTGHLVGKPCHGPQRRRARSSSPACRAAARGSSRRADSTLAGGRLPHRHHGEGRHGPARRAARDAGEHG